MLCWVYVSISGCASERQPWSHKEVRSKQHSPPKMQHMPKIARMDLERILTKMSPF